MTEVKKIPDGYRSITPALIVNDAVKAIEYYKKVFGANQRACMIMPDGKKVAHGELEIGDSLIMMGDEFPEMNFLSPTTIGGSPISLVLYVEDVDKTFNLAVSEGAKVLDPVVDQFWGDRLGSIEDPFGHRWSIMTHIKDLTPEEMKKAAEEAFAKMSK
jgi:PhnB protein